MLHGISFLWHVSFLRRSFFTLNLDPGPIYCNICLVCLVKIVRYFRSLVYSIMKRRKQKPFKILGSMTTLTGLNLSKPQVIQRNANL